jgi:hypothetical protein
MEKILKNILTVYNTKSRKMKEYATRPFRKQKIRKWKKMQQNSNTVTTFRKQNVGIWKKIKM